MEIHHQHHRDHPQHKEKLWKHYALEFFMLFLAVSAGFFVENYREHLVDHEHEKQYMKSFLNDLQTDVRNIDTVIYYNLQAKQQCDSLFQLLSLSDYSQHTGSIYFNGRAVSLRHFFYISDGTLSQLNNAGGLRLIHDQQLVDSIESYERLYSDLERTQSLKEAQLIEYRDACTKIFDVKIFEEMLIGMKLSRPAGAPKLLSENPMDINVLLMRAHYLKRNNAGMLQELFILKRKAMNMQAMIRNEYRLE